MRSFLQRAIPAVALAVSLAACARYTPKPLDGASAILAAPDPAILSADAATIDRPYLSSQPIDLGAPLTPNALAVIAVVENPDLKAQRTKAGVTDAQAFAARLLPDPTFQGGVDALLSGPDAFTGLASQIGFDLNQLRTARATREAGAAAKRQVRLDLAWAEWQVAGQARLQGVRILALDGQFVLARESAATAQRLFDAVQRAAGRGDVAAGDLDVRRQALLDATTRMRTLENDLTMARGDLNRLLGLPPAVALRLAAPAPAPLPPAAAALTAQAIDRRLDLQALRAGYGVAEADLRKAVLDQFPTLSLTMTAARDTADNRTLGPQIGFTLPLWNRNRGGIAIAKATREQVRAEYDARLFQTRAEISAGVAGLATLRRQHAELAAQFSAIEAYTGATERAAKRGDLASATADAASQALRDRKLSLLQLDQQIAEQTIALELLAGGPSEGWTR